MSNRRRLTNSSDETEVSALISGDTVFAIPYFQRAYKWKPPRLRQLNKDILDVVNEDYLHFLGAIIIHGRPSNPSDPDVFDVIDGQQRLTTLVIYLCALVKVLCLQEQHSEAASLFLKYLALARDTRLPSNFKLHPCKEDRAQLNAVYADLLSDPVFREQLAGFKPKYLPADDRDNGRLRLNYKFAVKFLKDQLQKEGLGRIHAVSRAILKNMSVVQIVVWDPTNGPKIFDGLNSRQEPMTIGDLVRNEIFRRVAAEDPEVLESIDASEWQPFYQKFREDQRNQFDAYFFPYGLIQDPNVKKAEVYTTLREAWEEIVTPGEIIDQLATYQDAFLDLVCGTARCGHPSNVSDALRRYYEMGAPSSVYPFLMQLSNALKDGEITEVNALESLGVVESFLVRRAVCGHEPTGLHAVFKRLWTDCHGKVTGKGIEAEIRRHSTVVWPTDEDLARAVMTRQLSDSRIVRYLLVCLDRELGGDQPDSMPWIEHVWPRNPAREWEELFSETRHRQLRGRLANLIPLSKELNQKVSNKGYSSKRPYYLEDSMFKTAREFAKGFRAWNPVNLKRRGEDLAKMTLARWPH